MSRAALPESLPPLRERQTLPGIDADARSGEAHTGPCPAAEFWSTCDREGKK